LKDGRVDSVCRRTKPNAEGHMFAFPLGGREAHLLPSAYTVTLSLPLTNSRMRLHSAFNYGIHAYTIALRLLGPGIASARHLGQCTQHQIELCWHNGARAIINVGPARKYLPFYATVITDRRVTQLSFDARLIYKSLLEAILPFYCKRAPVPVSMEALIECELAAIAARVSWQHGNILVNLRDLRLDDPGYDGFAFAESYRLSKVQPQAKDVLAAIRV
jgi:hypothetical protein